ncbi:MAG: hypothetical protein R6X29_10515 [Acidimicrobiia bacterium]|jgi:hypothetical protein
MSERPTAVETSAANKPGFWTRHGWKLLIGLVVVIGLFGIGDVIVGLDADPAIPEGVAGLSPDQIREMSPPVATLVDLQVRAGGLHLLVMSVLWTVIVLVPYRRGERWAWYTMWTFPAWSLGVAASFLFVELQPDVPPPPPAVSGWVFFGLTALLLLGTRRGFESSR